MKGRSHTSASKATKQNSGPGRSGIMSNGYSDIDLGLSSREKVDGGTAGKLRGETDEGFQAPKGMHKTVSNKRGKFQDMG